MRLCVLLLLGSVAWAGDLVHLKNGRALKGKVVSEDGELVVVDVGAGRVSIPRKSVRLIERGVLSRETAREVTQRDEWFLVLHRGKLVGWRRVVHTEGPERVHVEERTVFFRPGGGDDVGIRRVEIAGRDGRPIEFLLSETYGRKMETVYGRVADGRATVRIRRDGEIQTKQLELPEGCKLALPAWSRFLERAKRGESRTITALDLRRLRPVTLVLRREEDTALDRRPCRALTLAGNFKVSRAFYRPGEGSLSVQLNGETLVAQRASRERVCMARRVHAAPRPLSVREAQLYPFHRRPEELTCHQVQAGVSLKAPDAGWIPRPEDRARGLVLTFEKVSLFASLELFAYALPAGEAGADACLEQGLARLRLTAGGLDARGLAKQRSLAGLPSRQIELEGRHRGEQLRCRAVVVRAKDRYLLLLAAAPHRWWRWAERDFEAFFESLVVVD